LATTIAVVYLNANTSSIKEAIKQAYNAGIVYLQSEVSDTAPLMEIGSQFLKENKLI